MVPDPIGGYIRGRMSETPETTSIGRGRHLELRSRDGWEYVTRPDADGVVAIAAVTDAGEIVLVEQFRPPVGTPTLELPAGLVGDEPGEASEEAEAAARRELSEETGFTADEWHRLGACVSSGGLTDEIVEFFAASRLRRVGPGGGVGGERIRVHLVACAEAHDWLAARMRDGASIDAKVYAGLAMLERHRAAAPS